MSIVYLECINNSGNFGEKYLELGKVYEAELTTAQDGVQIYSFVTDNYVSHQFTVLPDAEGLSYKNWFQIVDRPEKKKEMWTVTIMNYYYPTVLHFKKEEEARKWYNAYLEKKKDRQAKENNFENYESVYLSKIEERFLSTENPWEDITWDATKEDF